MAAFSVASPLNTAVFLPSFAASPLLCPRNISDLSSPNISAPPCPATTTLSLSASGNASSSPNPKRLRRVQKAGESNKGGTDASARKWRVAAAASAVHALHAAVVYLGPATLLSPMRHELSLSITQIALPLNVFRVINCILLIPAGVVLDRVGAHHMIWPTMVITGVCAALAPFATTLFHLTALQAVFGLCFLFGGFTSMLMMVNEAFDRDSNNTSGDGAGVGAGIVLAGWSLAGCIAPGIIGVMATRHGWRVATAVLNGLFIFIGLPLTYIYLRGNGNTSNASNGRKSLARDSSSDKGQQRALTAKKDKIRKKEPLFTQRYVATLAALAAMSLSYHVVLDHLPIFMREDLGVPFEKASFILATMNLCGFISKLGGGWLSERFPVGLLFTVFTILAGLSCFFLVRVTRAGAFILATSRSSVLAFSLCFGLTYSVVFTLITTALREFGPRRLGLRSNLNLMFLFGFGSIGSSIAGASRMANGSYAESFTLASSMWPLILAFVAVYCHGGRKKAQALRNER